MKRGRSKGPVLAACLVLGLGAGAAATLAIASAALAAQAAELVVERDTVDVRDMAASYGDVVATAKKDDRLTVVARKGKWLNVRTADAKTGWVAESSLSRRGSGADDALGAKGGGFDKLAKARGWDKDRVYAIEERTVDPKAVRRFAEEGRIGPRAEGGGGE